MQKLKNDKSKMRDGLPWNQRSGAATVELAICLPILMTLTLGICELGQAFKVEAILSQAARKACAAGSRPGGSNGAVIADALNILSANKIPTDSVLVTVLVNDEARDVRTAQRDDKITVTISIPISKVNWTNTVKYLGVGAVLSETFVMTRQG